MRTILIVGASKGLGNSLVAGICKTGDNVYMVSRSEPLNLKDATEYNKIWVEADLSTQQRVDVILNTIASTPIDVIIFNAGIWESTPFEKVMREEVLSIINVNLTSTILLLKDLLPNVRAGNLKKVIFIGSTCGLENEGSDAIVYCATKFGIRGVTHALREYLRRDDVGVSCISPGSVASDIRYLDGTEKALSKYSRSRIPVSDIVNLVNLIITTSTATCIKEIHLPAMKDTDV